MRKDYFLLFGSNEPDVVKLVTEVSQMLKICFTPHESDYLGNYFLYQGICSDKISIHCNFVGNVNEWREEKYREFPTLIYVANYCGKNLDKNKRTDEVKLNLQMNNKITLLKEDIIES